MAASSKDMKEDGSAVHKVFKIPELLEMILTQVILDNPTTGIMQVLKVQRVNRDWKELIEGCDRLRQLLHLSPSTTPVFKIDKDFCGPFAVVMYYPQQKDNLDCQEVIDELLGNGLQSISVNRDFITLIDLGPMSILGFEFYRSRPAPGVPMMWECRINMPVVRRTMMETTFINQFTAKTTGSRNASWVSGLNDFVQSSIVGELLLRQPPVRHAILAVSAPAHYTGVSITCDGGIFIKDIFEEIMAAFALSPIKMSMKMQLYINGHGYSEERRLFMDGVKVDIDISRADLSVRAVKQHAKSKGVQKNELKDMVDAIRYHREQ